MEGRPLSGEEVQALRARTGLMQTVADERRSGMKLGLNPQICATRLHFAQADHHRHS